MDSTVECLSCGEVEALGCFQLSDTRYDDNNTVTERFNTTVQQLYLIWIPAQILEHVIDIQRWIEVYETPKMESSLWN